MGDFILPDGPPDQMDNLDPIEPDDPNPYDVEKARQANDSDESEEMLGAGNFDEPNEDSAVIKNSTENPIDSDEIPQALKSIRDRIEQSERPVREVLIRQWKLQQLFWQGIQRIIWNEEMQDLRSIEYLENIPDDLPVDISDYGKIVNIYRGYGEAIAGALTTGLPKVRFYPKDAERIQDILKSKGYSKLAELISIQNNIIVKLTNAVVIAYNQGFVAAYNYNHTHEKYGMAEIESESLSPVDYQVSQCPECGYTEEEKFTDNTVMTNDETLNPDKSCPQCSQLQSPIGIGQPQPPPQMMPMGMQTQMEMMPKIEKKPKSRQIIEFWGPLNVKIPASAQTIDQVGWVILERERHCAEMRAIYPELREKISGGDRANMSYERWARANYENFGEYLAEYTTTSQIWLKPWAYELLTDVDIIEMLKEKYPDGAYCVFVNDVFAEACPAKLEDHWSFSVNPLSNRLLCESWGKGMVDLQEMTNDLILLELETIKYGIPMIFADPQYFDFKGYANSRAQPGMVYPLKTVPQGGPETIFYETKAATLSDEVPNLENRLKQIAEFISHAPPSIFGGPATGSKTLGEYEQSRNQALQVLSILWKVILALYTSSISKAVAGYHKSMLEDEKMVKPQGDSYVNILIKKSELDDGEIGEVYPEAGEQFPTTWPQKRAVLLELIGLQNDFINSILTHPENSYQIAQLLGLDDLFIPGDNQRNKQLYEIAQLLTQVSPDGINPSIPIDQNLDDSEIHHEIIKAYASSEHGMDARENNPLGYQNLMLHDQQHVMIIQMMMQQQAEAEAEANESGDSKSNLPVSE